MTSDKFIPTNQIEVATLTLSELESYHKNDLIDFLTMFNIAGKSKVKKDELVTLVFEASNVIRGLLVNQNDINQRESEKQDNKIDKSILSRGDIINAEKIHTALRTKKETPELIVKTIISTIKQQYNESNYKNLADFFRDTISAMLIDDKYQISLEEKQALHHAWINNDDMKASNKARRNIDAKRINSFADKPEKENLDADSIIEWALKNVTAKRHTKKAIALAILSGRRMVEIYGTSEYWLNDDGTIHLRGVAKKKDNDDDECNFQPLCDSKKWLKEFENLEYKGKTPKQVNDSNARMISRDFPVELKELGLEQFKDCRDFYAAVNLYAFKNLGKNIPEEYTRKHMGHAGSDATKFYRKFTVINVSNDVLELFNKYA